MRELADQVVRDHGLAICGRRQREQSKEYAANMSAQVDRTNLIEKKEIFESIGDFSHQVVGNHRLAVCSKKQMSIKHMRVETSHADAECWDSIMLSSIVQQTFKTPYNGGCSK